MQRLLAVIAIFLLAASLRPTGARADGSLHLLINGQEAPAEDFGLLMLHDRLYAPVRSVAESLGAQVDWQEQERKVTLLTPAGEQVSFAWESYRIDWNGHTYVTDAPAESPDGDTTYLPLRTVAEALNMQVGWDENTQTARLVSLPLYTVVEGDTWGGIAAQDGIDAETLQAIAGGGDLTPGRRLRTVIPELIRRQEDLQQQYLLAQIIDVEAGDEPMNGQIGVGDVILNRVKDDRFPDSIHDVIYAPHQFPPAASGELAKRVPSASAMEAAGRAMSGEDPAGDAVYFYNPRVDGNKFFAGLTTVADIGSHRFAK